MCLDLPEVHLGSDAIPGEISGMIAQCLGWEFDRIHIEYLKIQHQRRSQIKNSVLKSGKELQNL